MHPAVGILVGLILLVVGVALFVVPQLQPGGQQWWWLNQLITVVAGMLPAFLILIGIFLVWLQADELKSNKETVEEEEKPEKKSKK